MPLLRRRDAFDHRDWLFELKLDGFVRFALRSAPASRYTVSLRSVARSPSRRSAAPSSVVTLSGAITLPTAFDRTRPRNPRTAPSARWTALPAGFGFP